MWMTCPECAEAKRPYVMFQGRPGDRLCYLCWLRDNPAPVRILSWRAGKGRVSPAGRRHDSRRLACLIESREPLALIELRAAMPS